MHQHFYRPSLRRDANDTCGFCFTRCIRRNRKRLRIMEADELEGLVWRRPAGSVSKRNPETGAREPEGYTSAEPAGTAGNEREPSQLTALRPWMRAIFSR